MSQPKVDMSVIIAVLYDLSFLLLVGLALIGFFNNPRMWVNRYFVLATLSLLGWLVTLYLFAQATDSSSLTWFGRLNFTAILWAVVFGYCFMRELVGQPLPRKWLGWIAAVALTALTLLTGLIDAHESIAAGVHVTATGPLFILFAAHVVIYPAASIVTAVRAMPTASTRLRSQLSVIGLGIGVTTAIAILTGIILPYGYHIFGYEEIGALSTVLLVFALAYAITVQHLLDVRIVIRKALVFTVLVALVEKVYSGVIENVADALPGADQSAAFRKVISLSTMVFIAASFEPVKRWLEGQLDRRVFRRRHGRLRTGFSARSRYPVK